MILHNIPVPGRDYCQGLPASVPLTPKALPPPPAGVASHISLLNQNLAVLCSKTPNKTWRLNKHMSSVTAGWYLACVCDFLARISDLAGLSTAMATLMAEAIAIALIVAVHACGALTWKCARHHFKCYASKGPHVNSMKTDMYYG